MPPIIVLPERRLIRARRRAKLAQEQVEKRNLQEPSGQAMPRDRWINQRELGYQGEEAHGEFYGLELPEDDKFWKEPDVGPFEVRTATGYTARLVIQTRELEWYPNRPKSLAINISPGTFVLVGWQFVRAATELGEWHVYRQGGGAYYISQTKLIRMPEPSEFKAFCDNPRAWAEAWADVDADQDATSQPGNFVDR